MFIVGLMIVIFFASRLTITFETTEFVLEQSFVCGVIIEAGSGLCERIFWRFLEEVSHFWPISSGRFAGSSLSGEARDDLLTSPPHQAKIALVCGQKFHLAIFEQLARLFVFVFAYSASSSSRPVSMTWSKWVRVLILLMVAWYYLCDLMGVLREDTTYLALCFLWWWCRCWDLAPSAPACGCCDSPVCCCWYCKDCRLCSSSRDTWWAG